MGNRVLVIVAAVLLVAGLRTDAAQGGPVYTDTTTKIVAGQACYVGRVRVDDTSGQRWCCPSGTWVDCSSTDPITATGSTTARTLADLIVPPALPVAFNIVAEGDSITAGAYLPGGTTRWSDLIPNLSQFKGRVVTNSNVAVGGATIASITADYAAQVYPLRPAVVGRPVVLFVYICTNDLADGGIGDAAAYTATAAYWAQAKADGFTVVAFTVLRRSATRSNYIEAFNSRVRTSTGWDYLVDVARVIETPFNATFMQPSDTIHPNGAGHVLIAGAVNETFGGPPTARSSFTGEAPGAGFSCHVSGLGLATGVGNTSCGYEAGAGTTTGANLTAVGSQAAYKHTTGTANTAVGATALNQETTGYDNTAVGYRASRNQVGGTFNTSLGSGAAYTATGGSEVTALGYKALYTSTGDTNVAVGSTASYLGTTGSANTAVGTAALYTNTTGAGNVAVGNNAGRFRADGTTALIPNQSVYIGQNTRGLNDSDVNSIVIGAGAIGEGANTTVIGASGTTKSHLYGQLQMGAAGAPTLSWGTAAPTTGTWILGSKVWNSSPAVGQPKGWVCTVGGTPGTWVSEGNL